MIVRTFEELQGTERAVKGEGFVSTRYLLKDDKMGYTVSEGRAEAGFDMVAEYKHHLESCYIIEGKGTLENLETGEVHDLVPGVFYASDKKERHRFHVEEAMRLICVFNPALVGSELHDEHGAYAPAPESGGS